MLNFASPELKKQLIPAALVLLAPLGAWSDVEPVEKALRESKPIVDLRMRAESVEQAGLAKDAEALTLRARLGFQTGKAWNTSLLAESDLLWPLQDDYNSTTNRKTAYPIVADPETYEINQLALTNTSIAKTTVTLGRQRINLDDHRFVGNVGWRQNEQTYDALRVVVKPMPKLTFDLSYLNQVNRVFGKDAPITPASPAGRYHGDSYLANVAYQTPFGKLTGFSYLLDFEETQGLADSSATYGLRFTGEKPVGKIKLAYMASYATQSDYAGNPLNYDDDFYAAEFTGTLREYSLGVGMEVLEGNGVKGFTTPLATLHKFDGWADKFLTTPANGLQRRYVTAGYQKKKVGMLDLVAVSAVYHDFESARLGLDYGSEADLQLQAKWKRFGGLVKYADYQAHGFATDTRKWWLQVDYVW
jgi:hypothetical protein